MGSVNALRWCLRPRRRVSRKSCDIIVHCRLNQSTVKVVNNMRLQNVVMQLRKVCSHPFLFQWPTDPETGDPVLGAELVNASGKMMVLDRLLKELLKRGHRVLIFSQFVTVLDIIEVSPFGVYRHRRC